MGIYIEAFILYIILFFANSVTVIGNIPGEMAEFSVSGELFRIILYFIPSLCLIWYLILKRRKVKDALIKPVKTDIVSGFIAFPCLLITGSVFAFLQTSFGTTANSLTLSLPPSTAIEWAALCLTCFFASYLEESFFRYYLLSNRQRMKMNQVQALVFSAALFSVCHIYAGPFGFLNSLVSGAVLAFLYLRYRTLHGIAVAHGLYNIAAYVINFLLLRN